MKRYLLFVIAFVCTHIGVWADWYGASSGNNNSVLTFNTNGDSDCAELVGLQPYQFQACTEIIVNGSISQTGLNKIVSEYQSLKSSNSWLTIPSHSWNLSGATLSGDISSAPAIENATSIIFPAGTDLSGISFPSSYNYAYSADSGSGAVGLYASSNQTTLPAEITAAIETIKTNGINISGDGFDTMKSLLMEQGVPEDKIIQPFDGKATVAAGSVASNAAAIISDNGIAATDIKGRGALIHPETSDKLEHLLRMLAEKGEKETFKYIRKMRKDNV